MALNEAQIQKVRQTMFTSGWKEVMVPVLKARAQEAVKLLILHPSERKGEVVDDATLRARIQECEWMLAVWDNEIAIFDLNRRRDELDGDRAPGAQGEPLRTE